VAALPKAVQVEIEAILHLNSWRVMLNKATVSTRLKH
jgi:hypothetical protein